MRARLLWVVLTGAELLLGGCAGPGGPVAVGRDTVLLSVPYRSAGAGFGGTANSDVAVVPSGQHPPHVAALGLQQALAGFNAQLLAPEVVALTAADKDIHWRSDAGPLQAAQMAGYNAVATHPPLRDRIFGVRFSGRLLIVDNELRFSIEARVAGRSAGEAWQDLAEKDYDGAYFARLLADALKAQWRQRSGTS